MEMVFKPEMFFYSLMSLLLGVVVYFLKQLHSDFRRVEKDVAEVKTTVALIKAEFKGIHELMNQKVEFLEKRVLYLSSLFIKSNGKEKSDIG
jgi:hypothetical protein